ncbi:uncharacterized protein KY384_004007 [Bacidia gigantensis]|uniref:uncharacterized protein n=1 Tax=Bacidia gigantensis TaxID=2732470 RepID=UPI001D04A659|nr:uncharacterized protein KY384_004007 [Bacidia gigantensis]KAG8530652.1 hypothetical protein KY384_004007 [Bacidia gigantensis]
MQAAKATEKVGFRKLRGACDLASSQALEYIWIDTCCIDKSSSAELSEAINSMFSWYANAKTCYAFLADVDHDRSRKGQVGLDEFGSARWFQRGWTLQELIAPQDISFYDRNWQEIGDKTSLRGRISRITGIDESVLKKDVSHQIISVAKRMSWASRRVTTRPEDIAYCLMGLFNVNMPLIYGEGSKAFTRLQEEIIKYSTDQSLFAWTHQQDDSKRQCGLLAPSPSEFVHSSQVISHNDPGFTEPYSVSNMGLHIRLLLLKDGDLFKAGLDCLSPRYVGGSGFHEIVGVYLKLFKGEQYVRVMSDVLCTIDSHERENSFKTIYVCNEMPDRERHDIYLERVIEFRGIARNETSCKVYAVLACAPDKSMQFEQVRYHTTSQQLWSNYQEQLVYLRLNTSHRYAGGAIVLPMSGRAIAVLLGMTEKGELGFQSVSLSQHMTLEQARIAFNPVPVGQSVSLKPDYPILVEVNAHERIHQMTMIYNVRISFTKIETMSGDNVRNTKIYHDSSSGHATSQQNSGRSIFKLFRRSKPKEWANETAN